MGPVTIVIPTHNRAQLLPEAIDSALRQGELVGEVLVVDDGSTDDSKSVIESQRDKRVRLLSQAQSGPAAARDTGWRAANGRWIQFLDSDDALAPGAIEALHALAEAHPGRIPFGQSDVHPESFSNTPELCSLAFAHRSGRVLREISFYSAGTILSCLFPKEALERVGGLRVGPEAALCEDFDFALRLGKEFEFSYLPRVTYLARMHSENRHRANQRRVWLEAAGCLRRHLAGRPGCEMIRRRAEARFIGLVADDELNHGETALAHAHYLQCLRLWPVKLGAWKGLVRSLRRQAK